MKKVTLREYAKLYKLSYFNVMKMARNGELKSEIVKEDGKDVSYILLDENLEKEVSDNRIETEGKKLTLEEENIMLKQEVQRLREALEKCNKRTTLA